MPFGSDSPDLFTIVYSSVSAVLLVIGGIAGWYLRAKKDVKTIEKLSADITKAEGDLLKSLQTARREYATACRECGNVVDEMMHAVDVQASVAEFDEIRERGLGSLFHDVVPRFIAWMEWERLDRKEDQRLREALIRKEVVPELNRHRRWLDYFNHPNFLKHLQRAKAEISPRTLIPLDRLLLNYTAENRSELERLIAAARDALTDPATVPPVSDLFPEIPLR